MTKNGSDGDFDIIFKHVVSPQFWSVLNWQACLLKTNKAVKSYFNGLLVILIMGFDRLDKGNGGMVGRDEAVFW
jgi:hypothetical protein